MARADRPKDGRLLGKGRGNVHGAPNTNTNHLGITVRAGVSPGHALDDKSLDATDPLDGTKNPGLTGQFRSTTQRHGSYLEIPATSPKPEANKGENSPHLAGGPR